VPEVLLHIDQLAFEGHALPREHPSHPVIASEMNGAGERAESVDYTLRGNVAFRQGGQRQSPWC